jgi:hypothetical protein
MTATATSRPRPAIAERQVLAESTTIVVDAPPALTEQAVRRLDVAAPLVRALNALNVADRFALIHARAGGGAPLRLGLLWRIDAGGIGEWIGPECFESFSRPGYVKVRWAVEVEASDEGALLSIAIRFAATDARSAGRLLDAWSVIGPLSHAFRERAARAIKDHAEALAGE